MKQKHRILLISDAIINLLLGLLLLFFPAGVLTYLGLPSTNTYFYTSILGGVIFGIGVALSLEWTLSSKGFRGLGLGGAITINLCGGGTLLFWILFGNLEIPVRGQVTLWIVVVIVLGIGMLEILGKSWKHVE